MESKIAHKVIDGQVFVNLNDLDIQVSKTGLLAASLAESAIASGDVLNLALYKGAISAFQALIQVIDLVKFEAAVDTLKET